ncbi:unnamed protein product [Effrenium voratum]|nr:unnamed protein product [Effrenium voratum]
MDLLRCMLALVPATAYLCDDGTCHTNLSASFLQMQKMLRPTVTEHPWPHARGKAPHQFGNTQEVWTDHKLSWSYHHPDGRFHNIMAGGPVIDVDKNLYLMSGKGLIALSPSGDVRWTYETPGPSNNEVTLHGDLVLGTTKEGNAFAVDRHTGKTQWVTKLAKDAGGDCGYPAAFKDVFVVGAQQGDFGGNRLVMGLKTGSGEKLWEYEVDQPVWNLTPLFPGDDTVAFMDFSGGIYRLGLKNGTQIWRTPARESHDSFSDGGAGLGPNGFMYSCSNFKDSTGQEGQQGVARAYKLSDGSLQWERILSSPCNSYPAVGHVKGSDALAVVVTPGSFMGRQPGLHGSVLALDAATGKDIWEFHAKPYSGVGNQAAGDMEGALTRHSEGVQEICLPAHWSAPIIDAQGTVLAARSDGNLYQVFGPETQFSGSKEDTTQVNSGVVAKLLDVKSASLHGALAAAPGMFAMSTCDTLFVFQNGERR